MLRLNLFDDAVFSAVVERLTPTESGYVLSGRLDGVPMSTVTLVVNGEVVTGTVRSPASTYAIRSAGGGAHLIREVDPSRVLQELERAAPSWRDPGSDLDPSAPHLSPATDRSAESGADDGSVIDLIAFYTPAARAAVGGAAPMEALIDLLVSETNQAYRDSDVVQRIELVERGEVAYTEAQGNYYDMRRITYKEDGHADEIHAIRDVYAADMVHLLVASQECHGRAWIMTDVSHDFGEWAFSVSSTGCADLGGIVFAHELGHNMGLWHDRYAENRNGRLDDKFGNRPYPFSYGYVNQRAFEPNAPESSRWRTIMAQADQCRSFPCPPLLRFSNADQSVNGDALGVPGDQASLSRDGPADARRSLNHTRLTVANFRSSRDRATCRYAVTPNRQIVPAAGGAFEVRVAARPGCAWTAESDDPFLTVVSGEIGAGQGTVAYFVEANGESRRSGTIAVADQTLTIHQIGPDTPGVCTRTVAVREAISRDIGRDCWDVSDEDLARVSRLDLDDRRLTALPPSDLAGLTGLTDLRLADNRLTTLRRDTFAGMTNLIALSLASNRIAALPAGILAGLTRLEFLQLGGNQFTTIPVDIADLVSLESLYLYDNPLTSLPAGVFDDLARLRVLWLQRTRLAALPPSVFAGLSRLEDLRLQSNQLDTLPAGIFVGLANLKSVNLGSNPGAPFALTLHLARTEGATPVAGLASLAVQVIEGAPFEMRVNVSATPAGALSVAAAVVVAGAERSDHITVTQIGGVPVTVRLETPPPVPSGFWGIRTAVGSPLVIFEPANRPPVAVGTLAPLRVEVDDSPVTVDVAPAFSDPEGDALTYSATSSSPGVVSVAVFGTGVTVTPVAAGTSTVQVTATDPDGLSATQSFGVRVTVPFTDHPIQPGVTPVRAVHFTELRTRIDVLRNEARLEGLTWTDSVLRPGVTPVKLAHLLELRAALAAAYVAAGRAAPRWTDAAPESGMTPIKAAHLMELRAAVVALE